MSGTAFNPGNRRQKKNEVMDLDLTPVMNMLIILIPLLVSMAVFTQLSIIKFSLPPSSEGEAEDSAPKPREVDITLVLTPSGFQIIGEGKKLDPIPMKGGKFNFPLLGGYLKKLKEQYASTESVVLLIDTSIIYEDVIATMDICRDNRFPNIALSGGLE